MANGQQEQIEKSTKTRLIELYEDFHGAKVNMERSELFLIVDILELLVEQANIQDGHGHSIS